MKAFHGDEKIKEEYLQRVRAHAKADEVVKGFYWEDGKGCAVGCTIHSSDHSRYEDSLGIPEWLARVEDVIFEGLENDLAKKWPEQFLEAVNVGSDLEQIKTPFLVFILNESLGYLDSYEYDKEKFKDITITIEKSKKAVKEMIRCLEEDADASAARSAAWSARSAAKSAAWSARSAAKSAAESAAESAAWSARSAAKSAAWSAESAAESAAWSARSAAESAAARATSRSAESARSAVYKKHSEKLLELIKEKKK